jgi:chemotaxis protein MotA
MKNKSAILGYVLVVFFLYLAVSKGTAKPEVFFNIHGIALVIGGLVVAALASFPFGILKEAFLSVAKSISPQAMVRPEVAENIVQVGAAYQKGLNELEKESDKINHKFLSQSVNLMLEGIAGATVVEILNKRIDEKRMQVQSQMNVMLTLSKYAPALGLAATVLGLVDLLGQLDSADLAKLGYGMAIALSATFYGVILSNLVFAPLSEMIASLGEVETKELEMIRDGIQSSMEKKHPLVIGEIVNSYLEDKNKINFVEKLQNNQKAA